MANVIFKRGTKAKFNELAVHDANTLYWLKDVQELWMGDQLYGVGRTATTELAGLLSPEDKAKLDSLVSGLVNLLPADQSVFVTELEDGGKSVGVQISKQEGNALRLVDDGIFVPVPAVPVFPEFVIEHQETASDGCYATYKLKRIQGEEESYVGDPIDLRMDVMLQGGSLETVVVAGAPYDGAQVGDPYLDLVLNDEGASHIYVPVKGLVDVYVGGKGIEIVGQTIDVKIDEGNANGLFVGDNGIGLNLATRTSAGAMSAEDKLVVDSVATTYIAQPYKVAAAPKGTLVDYREKEIRIMCPEEVEWELQNVGAGGDPNTYYMTFHAYAPSNDVVGFKEDLGEVINDQTMYDFNGNGGRTDVFGRKYSVMWLALAKYDEATGEWNYYGANSTTDHYVGFTYSVEWYDANGICVGSDMIRINLSNKDCHHVLAPGYLGDVTAEMADMQKSIAQLEASAIWTDL